MKASFAVPAILWTTAYLVSNYTSIVPTVRGWVSTPAFQPKILGQNNAGNLYAQVTPDDPGRFMSRADFDKLQQSRGQSENAGMPLLAYALGMFALYGIAGINAITEWERRPVMLFGRYQYTAGPGLVWVDPVFHGTLDDVSVQDVVDELEVGSVQTHDNVPVSFKAIITKRVDAEHVRDFCVGVEYGDDAVEQRALAAFTEAVSRAQLDHILHDRATLTEWAKARLQASVGQWGVTILALELKDIKIADESIQAAIAMKARASKEADAELVRAQMQHLIAKELNAAAAVYNAEGKWLKGLESMLELCRSGENNTILIPTDLPKLLGSVIRS